MEHPVILFDGVCNFCNSAIQFVIRQDAKEQLYFAPLQSPAAQKLLQQHHLPQKDFETFLLLDNNTIYQKSDAALRVAKHFKWYWQWVQVLQFIPSAWRNAVYSFVARNRYRWFGKRDACMIPTEKIKKRFLTGEE